MESVTSFGLQHKICVHFTRPQVNRSYCQSSKHIPPISFTLNKKTGADSTLAALRSEPGRFSAWAGYTSPLTLRFRPVTGRIAGHGSHTQTILNWGNKKPVSRMIAAFLIRVSVVSSCISVSVCRYQPPTNLQTYTSTDFLVCQEKFCGFAERKERHLLQ